MKPIICIVTGPPGVGKSSVTKELAKAFPKTARIDVDLLREMIQNGNVEPAQESSESHRQIALASENACVLAKNFSKAGFNVFIDDVAFSKKDIDFLFKRLGKNILIFRLCSDKKTLQKRDTGRSKKLVVGKRAIYLHNKFSKRNNEKRWHTIDTTKQTAKQTAKEILKIIKKE